MLHVKRFPLMVMSMYYVLVGKARMPLTRMLHADVKDVDIRAVWVFLIVDVVLDFFKYLDYHWQEKEECSQHYLSRLCEQSFSRGLPLTA